MGSKLILGGASGIGWETARILVERGHEVVIASRSEERCREQAGQLGCRWASVDARDFSAVEQLVGELGSVDAIACCPGSIVLKPAHLTSSQELMEVLQTNLFSAFACVRALARHCPGPSSLVLFSTVAAAVGLPNHEAVAAAKAGVEGLARSAAATYAARPMRVNVVAPGLVNTPLAEKIVSRPTALKASEAMIPLGRIGQPNEVAEMVAWLLGEGSGWVSGQVFHLDGGMSSLRTPPRAEK